MNVVPVGLRRAQGSALLGLLHTQNEPGHNQALIALARRRCDVLFAMMRDGTFYTLQAP